MRKRRRLANKMTIMVCAVLIAVSAFFYAPMEVEAGASETVTSFSSDLYRKFSLTDSNKIYLKDYLDSDVGYYRVSMDITVNYNSDVDVWLNNFFACFNSCGLFEQLSFSSSDWESSHTVTERRDFYLDASSSRDSTVFTVYYLFITALRSSSPSMTVNCSYSVSNVLVQEISSIDYDSYTQGYNAGYSDGAMIGYGDGYSDGFKDGEISVDIGAIYDEGYQAGKDSVDTDAFYDEGYQAGKDSVDTDSYFDAGYQQGYQVAYSSGYDEGYQVAYDIAFSAGYDKAMGDISQWGADTSDYPLFLKSYSDDIDYNFLVEHGVTRDYPISLSQKMSISIDPNHTYKIVFDVSDYDITTNSNTESAFASDVYLYVGSLKYFIANQSSSRYNHVFFVPGDKMGDYFTLQNICYNMETFNTTSDQVAYWKFDYNMSIYDMGPTGDTQNHIANQTDKLNENSDKNTDIMVNGFDESQGNSVNSDLSSGLNEYQTAEDSLWATATTGLKDFTFFDFESVPAMITGMSFITSIMGSWFSYAGGASGVGIVLSILFSVMLVAMVLGLYRLYQSKGGKK